MKIMATFKKDLSEIPSEHCQLDPNEQERYSRQITVQEFGHKGQAKLKSAHLLVYYPPGGETLLYYLAAAGLGQINYCCHSGVKPPEIASNNLPGGQFPGALKAATTSKQIKNYLEKLNPNTTTIDIANISPGKKLPEPIDLIIILAGPDQYLPHLPNFWSTLDILPALSSETPVILTRFTAKNISIHLCTQPHHQKMMVDSQKRSQQPKKKTGDKKPPAKQDLFLPAAINLAASWTALEAIKIISGLKKAQDQTDSEVMELNLDNYGLEVR